VITRLSLLIAAAAMLPTANAASAEDQVLRIGYQKYGTLVFEKARGTLDARLRPLGMRVSWTEFMSGPALFEAMGAGSLDFGLAGDTPPIFAQAGGVELAYVGVEPSSPHGEAIIVPKDSPVHGVADLKGKRVALNKGSNVHNLLVRVLAANGMSIHDVRTVFLSPSDARPAYESGSVDAWVIWDPYLAAAQAAVPSRTIADGIGRDGRTIDENRQFFIASRAFATVHAGAVRAVLADMADNEAYAAKHRDEMVGVLAPAMGMQPQAVKLAVDRTEFGVQPVTDSILAGQQDIADTFAGLGLIPEKVIVGDMRWTPK